MKYRVGVKMNQGTRRRYMYFAESECSDCGGRGYVYLTLGRTRFKRSCHCARVIRRDNVSQFEI